MPDEVHRLVATHSPVVADLTHGVCALVDEVLPGAVVTSDEHGVGFGAGTGYKGLIFTVFPHQSHVTLGIARGVGLPDPAGLMEGKGKLHRHVKIREAADLARPELRELMLSAVVAHSAREA